MVNTLKTKQIPLLDLKAQYSSIQDEIENAVLEVLRSAHFVMGPNVKAFEEEAAKFLGAKHAITCANGSDALYLALLALDIKAGDEVITTPFTFAATAEAISETHAVPVFADIDLETYNIDPQKIEEKITPRTKAIIVVHLYGQACDMDAIMTIARKHNLKVIEDTAQAFGTTYTSRNEHNTEFGQGCRFYAGCIGDIGTYSFYPTKNLSAAGDAGMLTTNNDELASRLKRIRVHGSDRRYYHDELGVNSRMDEIQAAILRIKLKHISSWNTRRTELANIYNQKLATRSAGACSIRVPKTIPGSNHIYHQYTIRLENPELTNEELSAERLLLKTKLQENNISSEIYYPLPLHMQKLYTHLSHKPEDFPNSLRASNSILCLPIYPELSNEDLDYVISKF